jgi:TonB-linked SusC/RagA family outer membrane protein
MLRKFFLVFLMVLYLFSPLSAQITEIKVSVNFKNEPVTSALREVERQTGINFVYNADHLKNVPPVTLSATDMKLEVFLSYVLENHGLSFTIEKNNIIIKPEDKKDVKISYFGVVNDDTGDPLPGVSIRLKSNTKIGTTTGEDGRFFLSVPPIYKENSVVIFSFIGYEVQTMTLDDLKDRQSITMKLSAMELGDVVVTGIFKKSAESFTGAVATVTAQYLLQNGNRNLIQSLSNLDPTINILENNLYGSNPNRLPELQIRGNSSVPNISELQDETKVGINTPLIVLDGFETTLQKLYDLNENEVESLTILKDASATAIYGSRGANGVIVITTKAPAMGKLRVSFKSDLNIEAPDLSGYSVLNAKDKLALESRVGLYTSPYADQWMYSRYYSYLLSEINSGVDTYWLSMPLRVGVGHKQNIKIEGGDKTFRYSASAQYSDNEGVMKGSYRKSFNGTINLSYILNKVKFTNTLMIGLGNSQESQYGSFSDYVIMNPYWRAYDNEGNALKFMGIDPLNDYTLIWGRDNDAPTSPLYNATLNCFDRGNSFDVTNNFSLEWKVFEGMILKAKLGLYKSSGESNIFKSGDHTDFADYSEIDLFRKGSYRYGVTKSDKIDGSLNASYKKIFGKHQVYAGADINVRESQALSYGFLAEGFNNEDFSFIAMALQYAKDSKPSGSESLVRAIGVTANVNYTYDNKYYVDASYRNDGSSQFGSNRRFAPFWSLGAGWNIHKEGFFMGIDWVDYLKVRASVGTTGSQNFNAYQALSTYRYFADDRYFNWIGAQLMGLGNKDLQWQQKFNINLGFEIKLFDNRFSLVADIYNEKTTDLISAISSPASNGFTSYIENIGSMKNKGFEIKATASIIRKPNDGLTWNVTLGAVQNRNKIISVSEALLDAQKEIEEAKVAIPSTLYKPGYSTNTLWVVPSSGIDPSNGKEVYIDRFGNSTYMWDARDIVACHSTEPVLNGIINTALRYKGFMLNVSLGYKFGGYAYNQTLINKVENANYLYNVDSRVYHNRWSQPGDIAAFKGLDVTETTYKTSRFVQKENMLRCQSLTLQYELKKPKMIRTAPFENILFSASTSDLFYLSSIKRERGLVYPYSHQFNFSINITF